MMLHFLRLTWFVMRTAVLNSSAILVSCDRNKPSLHRAGTREAEEEHNRSAVEGRTSFHSIRDENRTT